MTACRILASALLPVATRGEITFMVRSQNTTLDNALLGELLASVTDAGLPPSSVIGMAEAEQEFEHGGLWTYKPWIFLAEKHFKRSKRRVPGGQRWVVFLEPATAIDVPRFQAVLQGYDAREPLFIGRVLRDKESSIVHHYNTEIPYPFSHSGFALSGGLIQKLARDLKDKPLSSGQQIEPVWELAQWASKLGVELTDKKDTFCTKKKPDCASWVTSRSRLRTSGNLTSKEVIIGVKTVDKFHSSRIPLIHEFWGAQSQAEVMYLSNQDFSDVPGANVVNLTPDFGGMVDPSKESTKQGSGHCTKMVAILKYFSRHHPGKRWYVVTDDDTLLNVPQLLEVLGSHDDSKPLYIGERYGWSHREEHDGTNYITTGGGMALSAAALATLDSCKECVCRAPNAPDDMTLGSWFTSLRVPVIHEEGFHQSEPHNYHPQILRYSDKPISFHRYNVRLPSSVPESERTAARHKNWKKWVDTYFVERHHSEEL